MNQQNGREHKENQNPAIRAVALLGGYQQAAKRLTEHTGKIYTVHAVRKWYQKQVAHDAVIAITTLLAGQMSPYELRPDIYPDPDWMPPGVHKAGALPYRKVLELCRANPDVTPHQLNPGIYPDPDWRLSCVDC